MANPHLTRTDLQDAYRRSAACTRKDIDADEADELAAILQRELIVAEETYQDRLKAIEESIAPSNKDNRDAIARLKALQITIGTLLSEHESE